MLVQGETFNERKSSLWSYLHTSQDLIKAVQKIKGDNLALAREVIVQERETIKTTYADLKELQRWFKTSGLEPDEPYYIKREGKNERNGLLA